VDEHGAAREELLGVLALIGALASSSSRSAPIVSTSSCGLPTEHDEFFGRHQAGIDGVAQDTLGAVAGSSGDTLDGPLAPGGVAEHGAMGGKCRVIPDRQRDNAALDIDQRGSTRDAR